MKQEAVFQFLKAVRMIAHYGKKYALINFVNDC